MEVVFYSIPDECSKCCGMLGSFTGNQTKHPGFIVQ